MCSPGLSDKTHEWLTKEGNKPPQEKKNNLRRVFKQSKSLNDISTINQSKLDNQPRKQQNTTDKHPCINKATRTKRIKRFQSRSDGSLLLRNKGIKGHQNKEEPETAAQIYKPETYCSLKTTTNPDNGFELVSAAPANQDAVKTANSFNEQISNTQSNSGKCAEVVPPVLKSKLAQHHPADEVIQDNNAALLIVASQKCHVSGHRNDQVVRLDNEKSHARPGSHKELEDQRISKPAGQTFECAEHGIQASTLFAPLDIRADLETMTRHMHHGFAGNQVFGAEISRILSEILGALQRWTSDVENILTSRSGNEFSQHNKECIGHVMAPTLIEHVERSLTGSSAPLRDHSASRILEVTSASQPIPDITGHLMIANRKAQRILSKTHERAVVNLSGGNPAHADETTVIGCPEPLVFIDSYFAKPEEATAKVSRSDLGLSTNQSRLKSQSCHVVSVKYSKELNSGRSPSKVRKGLEESSEEIEILDDSELPIMSVQERRSQIKKSARSRGDAQEEMSVCHMDSCEEVREERNQRERESFSDSRKDKKSECSIS